MSTEGSSNLDAAPSAAAEPTVARPRRVAPAVLAWLVWMLVWGAATVAWLLHLQTVAHAEGFDYGVMYPQLFGVALTLLGVVLVAVGRTALGLGLAALGVIVCTALFFSAFQPAFAYYIGNPLVGHLFGWAVGLVNVIVLFVLLRARRAPALSQAPQL